MGTKQAKYVRHTTTASLAHVHETSFVATELYLKSWKSSFNVQLYDGISVPVAIVHTSVCSVSPTGTAFTVTGVEVLLSTVPAAESQSSDAFTLTVDGNEVNM